MVGVDIVAINRIERLLEKYNTSFLKNFLCQSEIDLCVKKRESSESSDFGDSHLKSVGISHFNIERIAGFYAAKEAIAKALRCGISKNLAFHDIILSKDSRGAPKAKLSKRAKKYFKVKKIHISISHDKARIYDKNARGKDSHDNDSHKNAKSKGFAIAIAMMRFK